MGQRGKGKPVKFTVTETGEEHNLKSFQEKHAQNLSISQLRHKYTKLGRPSTVSISDMLLAAVHGGKASIFITVGEGRHRRVMTLTDIARACNKKTGLTRPGEFFYRRWVNEGRKKRLKNIDVFLLSADEYKAYRLRLKGHRSNIDLSHIPQGDLAYLMGKDSSERREPLVDKEVYNPSLMEVALLAL